MFTHRELCDKFLSDTFLVDLEEIGPLQCLEAKVLVVEIPVVDDRRVESLKKKRD